VSPPVKPKGATRRERAQATRRRILIAAHELFVERGFTGTRMADVAAKAGVAVQTVYFIFHTKGELLSACIDRAVLGEEEPLPPQQQPFWIAMVKAKTGAKALRHFAEGNGAITARLGKLDTVLSSAVHDPDVLAIWAYHEALRRAGYTEVVEQLVTKFGLRKGLDVKAATDILLVMGSGAMYTTLVLDYGWQHDAFNDWLAQTLADALLGS
jgi:AcrR family transcriptional regulator